MYILIIGPPGAGKGTQAEKLAEKFNLACVEMGSLLRRIKEEDTPLGNKVKEFVEKGILVPDELINDVLNNYLRRIEKLDGTVFDGFPRVVSQAKYFDEFLAGKGKKIDLVVYLALPREETFKRLSSRRVCSRCGQVYNLLNQPPKNDYVCDSCGGKLIIRSDETPEAINKRLTEFEKQTRPLVKFYQTKGILEKVDGNRSIEAIAEDIFERLKKRGLA